MTKAILVSGINPAYSQEQPAPAGWSPFMLQQQQEGPGDIPPTQSPTGLPNNQQQQQQQTPEDPFAELLKSDNLDDVARAAIEKARITFANTTKEQKELAEKVEKLTKVASTYQSQADKANALLKKHNLTEGDPNKLVKSPEDAQVEAIAAEYVKRGMKPEQAMQYAEMMSVALGVVRPGILNEVGSVLGPAITQLNTINADRYLTAFGGSQEHQVAFKIPGVYDSAKSIVDSMIQNRQQVTQESVQAAIQMAIGETLMKAGGDLTNLQTLLKPGGNTTVTPPNNNTGPSLLATLLGGNLPGNGNFIAPNTGGNGGNRTPVPANDDTARANLQVIALMDRQIGKKGK